MIEENEKVAPSAIETLFQHLDSQGTIDGEIWINHNLSAKVRKVVEAPDRRLWKVCEPVGIVDSEVMNLILDMYLTMRKNDGIGIAAPQVGVLKRIAIIGLGTPLVLINPTVTVTSNETITASEGCLSFPGLFKNVERPSEIAVTYQDLDGTWQALSATGLHAVVIQHEVDHLNGKTIGEKPVGNRILSGIRRALGGR